MNICSLITVKTLFWFLNLFIVDGFTIKFLFNTITNFVPSIISFFQQIIIFNKKSLSSSLSFIIIFVTNKIILIFSSEEAILGINMLSISTSSNKLDFYDDEMFVFKRNNFFNHLLYTVKKTNIL